MAETLKPEVIRTAYIDQALINAVGRRGGRQVFQYDVLSPTPSGLLELTMEKDLCPNAMAWVSFRKISELVIKHADELGGGEEVIRSDRHFLSGETQFVTDIDEEHGIPVFATKQEILGAGILTPKMAGWMATLKARRDLPEEIAAFEPLIGRSLDAAGEEQ